LFSFNQAMMKHKVTRDTLYRYITLPYAFILFRLQDSNFNNEKLKLSVPYFPSGIF